MRRSSVLLAPLAILGGCAAVPGAPSLAPRATEAIDPRVPVENPVRVGPVNPSLATRLAQLVTQAQVGDAAFRNAAETAERLAAVAGPPRSESWVVAQQALSAAQAARAPTTRAMGDIDALAAQALASRGGIPAADLAAIQASAAEVSAIDSRQAQRIDALEARLGG